MSATGKTRATKIKAALLTLEKLNIPFSGPFITPKGTSIFVVDGCIVTESEVLVLYEGGHFTPENIGKMLIDLKLLQTTNPGKLSP